jgi:hypothetical protein
VVKLNEKPVELTDKISELSVRDRMHMQIRSSDLDHFALIGDIPKIALMAIIQQLHPRIHACQLKINDFIDLLKKPAISGVF